MSRLTYIPRESLRGILVEPPPGPGNQTVRWNGHALEIIEGGALGPVGFTYSIAGAFREGDTYEMTWT